MRSYVAVARSFSVCSYYRNNLRHGRSETDKSDFIVTALDSRYYPGTSGRCTALTRNHCSTDPGSIGAVYYSTSRQVDHSLVQRCRSAFNSLLQHTLNTCRTPMKDTQVQQRASLTYQSVTGAIISTTVRSSSSIKTCRHSQDKNQTSKTGGDLPASSFGVQQTRFDQNHLVI